MSKRHRTLKPLPHGGLFAAIAAALIAAGAARAADDGAKPVDTFNYVLGTQTIGAKYQFTEKARLVETAEAIRAMGSNLIKFSMSRRRGQRDGQPKPERINSLTDLAAKDPSIRKILDMPFAHYHIWAYCFGSGRWNDGLSSAEVFAEYREMHALAQHLLKTYSGTGKTFLLGHWEGDWHLHANYDAKKDPPAVRIRSMIDWLNIRQKAVDDAKRDTKHRDVELYHYTEVNLVRKAIAGGKCLTNSVLPHTNVDFVSYSCYDTINAARGNVRAPLHAALNYIESKLPAKPGIDGKRVFIGEYGFPLQTAGTPQKQDAWARDTARAALQWGCPYVLYWQMYCNEIKDGKHRGFWLIDDKGREQPFYFTLQRFYGKAGAFVASFRKANGRPPTREEFIKRAAAVLVDPKE